MRLLVGLIALSALAQSTQPQLPTNVAIAVDGGNSGIYLAQNETPIRAGQWVWSLKHAAIWGAACTLNGVKLSPGPDYTLIADALYISSANQAAWAAGVVLCTYPYPAGH